MFSQNWQAGGLVLTGVITVFLLSYRLPLFPAPWFDEGINLQAAKNMALRSQYALGSGTDFRLFDPAVQTGPTVILPIALVFRWVGVGVFQGRMAVACYALAAAAVFYLLVSKVYTKGIALLGVILLILPYSSGHEPYVVMGRQVLGEVPALLFFWSGTLIWFSARQPGRWRALAASGALWGLAMVTKVQFILPISFTLLSFWLYGRFTRKEIGAAQVLLPLSISASCVVAWYGYQALLMGVPSFLSRSRDLSSAGVMHLLRFSPQRIPGRVLQLLDARLAFLGVPAMAFTVAQDVVRGDARTHLRVFLVTFALVWSVWFSAFSVGWERYAFVAEAMLPIFSAALLVELWAWASQRQEINWCNWLTSPRCWAIGGVVVVLLLSGGMMLKRMITSPDSGLQAFADYLRSNVSPEVTIESWEYELGAVTDHAYHYPPYQVTNAYTEFFFYGKLLPLGLYDVSSFHPEYIIEGSFARKAGIYAQDIAMRGSLVVQIGEYKLYRLRP